MRPIRIVALMAVLAIADVSCRSPTNPPDEYFVTRDPRPWFQTDSLHYAMRTTDRGYETFITVTFTNPTARTAYFVNCGGSTHLRLERLADDQWEPFWSAIIFSCLSPPIIVPPGDTYQKQVWIFGGFPEGNTVPRFPTNDVAGVYRLVWPDVVHDYQPSSPWGEPLPLTGRVSNRFVLTIR